MRTIWKYAQYMVTLSNLLVEIIILQESSGPDACFALSGLIWKQSLTAFKECQLHTQDITVYVLSHWKMVALEWGYRWITLAYRMKLGNRWGK
jgi:hypothetical protein